MAGLAPILPLRKDDIDGYKLIKSYEELARQNLKMLVLTGQGERMMDPEFGVGLRRYLFEPNNPFTYGNIEAAIRSQVTNYLPYIEILAVNFKKSEELTADHLLNVEIEFFVVPLQIKSTLLFDLEWTLDIV